MKVCHLAILIALAVLVGCAPVQARLKHIILNDPAKSVSIPDRLSGDPGSTIPIESMKCGELEIGYNLVFENYEQSPGYRLTVMLRNDSHEDIELSPSIVLLDSLGFVVPGLEYSEFMVLAAQLEGVEIPTVETGKSPSTTTSGTITTPSGKRYNYTSQTQEAPKTATGSLLDGMAQGRARSAAVRAKQEKERGSELSSLGRQYWLKSDIVVPSGAVVLGIRWFPADDLGILPIHVRIEVNECRCEFTAPGS